MWGLRPPDLSLPLTPPPQTSLPSRDCLNILVMSVISWKASLNQAIQSTNIKSFSAPALVTGKKRREGGERVELVSFLFSFKYK